MSGGRSTLWVLGLATLLAASQLACGSSAPGIAGAAGMGGTSSVAGSGGAAGMAGQGGAACGSVPDGAVADAAVTDVAVADGAVSDGADAGDAETEGGSVCIPEVAQHPEEGTRQHVDCAPAPVYLTNPPSSGNHYQIWADFKTYATPVPWGHLMHSMEHGAIVIVYNCPCGCPDEVAQAQAMIDALPVDPLCAATTKRRVILAPDPHLDVRWAASAWTWTIRSSCFDAAAFSAFAKAHYSMGGEDLCGEQHEPFCALP